MKTVFVSAWSLLDELCSKNNHITLLKDKQEDFTHHCCELYKQFCDKFMQKPSSPDTKIYLDRHKVGAIIAVQGAFGGYLQYDSQIEPNYVFLARYAMPIVVGLSLLEQEMNENLQPFCEDFNSSFSAQALYIPEPSSCDTKYINSLARMLYYEEQRVREKENGGQQIVDDMLLIILEFANTFFLLEECTLLFNHIDTKKWSKFMREHSVEE